MGVGVGDGDGETLGHGGTRRARHSSSPIHCSLFPPWPRGWAVKVALCAKRNLVNDGACVGQWTGEVAGEQAVKRAQKAYVVVTERLGLSRRMGGLERMLWIGRRDSRLEA